MKIGISLSHILERAKNADEVIIVGAGTRGRELLACFEKEQSVSVKHLFDNNENLIGSSIRNVKVVRPYKIKEAKCIYVIAVDEVKSREELRLQLEHLGIMRDDIVSYCDRDYDYLANLDEKYYKDVLQLMYYEQFGKQINWENPVTYNEKINWEKLYLRDARRTRLADKLLARDWVREQIGERYLTKLYGVWDDPEDIDFDALPDAFALKLNNGSDRNIIVKDKSQINRKEICKQLKIWKESNYAYTMLEPHYKDIVPKIICEEYLVGLADSVYDCDIYCFHGEPVYIWCIKGSHKPECRASFYNKNWEMMPFSYGYPKDEIAPKPEKLDEMLELSRILCKDFKHVRVDWYNLPEGLVFSEMTFMAWGGLRRFVPDEWDTIFGNMI